jgi:hypothetical protein
VVEGAPAAEGEELVKTAPLEARVAAGD